MINKITLDNFRLFNHLELNTSSPLVIIQGLNAMGKTSILESIFLCSSLKSFRTSNLTELIKDDKEYLKTVISSGTEYKVIISKDKKSYLINGEIIKKASSFIGNLKSVIVSPKDIDLIIGAKSDKRDFLDLSISLYDKSYLKHLSDYRHLLQERNDYLKKSNDRTYLNIITDNLINKINILANKRINFINRINEILKEISKGLLINDIFLEYKTSYDLNDIKKSFENKIEYDYLTKTTNIGIHRDYFLINYNDKDAKTYASEGEKRIIATAIKLALKKDIKNITGEDAILLLDDVFASLDRNKISSLVNYVKNTNQTFISATSLLEVPKELLTNALVIKINNKGD